MAVPWRIIPVCPREGGMLGQRLEHWQMQKMSLEVTLLPFQPWRQNISAGDSWSRLKGKGKGDQRPEPKLIPCSPFTQAFPFARFQTSIKGAFRTSHPCVSQMAAGGPQECSSLTQPQIHPAQIYSAPAAAEAPSDHPSPHQTAAAPGRRVTVKIWGFYQLLELLE